MEKKYHNQPTNTHQGMRRDDMKKTDDQTKKPETNEPTKKPTGPDTK